MFLQQDEVLSLFSAAYVQRGKDYYHRDKVMQLSIVQELPDHLIFETKAHGSGGRIYTQKVVVKQAEYGVSVSGYCSCPMDYNCKHVVAALLLYMNQQGASSPLAVNQWLKSFVETLQPHHALVAENEPFLVYVLKPAPSNFGVWVDFVETKPLKRGGLIKGKKLQFMNMTNPWSRPDCLQDEDKSILQLLKACNTPTENVCEISGEAGAIALQQMLKTERCFWESHQASVLTFSEVRGCQQAWQYDEQGNATFVFNVEPEARVIPTTPVMYVDEKQKLVGVLPDVQLNKEQLNMLLQMPKVPHDMVDEFSFAVAQSCPPNFLAPPKAMSMQEILGEKPKPYLLLMWYQGAGANYRLARIQFAYAGHEISCFNGKARSVLNKDGQVLVVERDEAAEDQWLNQFVSLGMSYCRVEKSEDLFFYFDEEDESEANQAWLHFIEHDLPMLREQGWQIEIEDDFSFEQQDIDTWFVDVEEQGQGWFDLRFDVEINGKKRALLPLLVQTLAHYDIEDIPDPLLLDLGEGKYTRIAKEKIMPMLQTIYELYDFQGDATEVLNVSRFESAALSDLTEQDLVWQGGEHLQDVARKLKHFSGIEAVEPPQGLQATLRPYQQQGLNWLQFLRAYDFNGILADDMGLGKTVQALAHLLLEKESGRMDKPCLIIVPTSLVSNWKREAAQFTPDLKVLTLQGAERAQHFDSIADYDVVISTYPLLRFDSETLLNHEFHLLILDEAQVIKNAKTKSAGLVRSIKAKHCLCVTGTPMENHLGELWSLFDFLMPGFLGDAKTFNRVFRKPIEKEENHDLQWRLNQRIKPFMLRRTKDEVATELPEKIEIIRSVALSEKQAMLYESIRVSMEEKVRKTIASKGLARSHITILDALLKLRQVCCDPRILSLKQANKLEESAKLELLMQMLPELLEEGRRVLLFSQFTKMLALIEGELQDKKISYSKLTGQTKNRDAAIEKFKQGEADVFLISLKAGGVGLNLTEADTVIHYDPWWNPAAENQATDRAHRIGQDKQVFVYKLVVENSVEEKIIAMQAKKQALADAVYAQGKGGEKALPITVEDMQDLFAPLQ